MVSCEKTQLVVLVHGLSPHVEALDCEDVKGPRSLFGESAPVPRPLRSSGGNGIEQHGARRGIRANSLVLWEDAEQRNAAAIARQILSEEIFSPRDAPSQFRAALDVPATTYIAGKCTSSFVLAWRLMECGFLPEWGATLCSCQTEGRGQLRRAWHSPRGNLYVSFRLPHDANLQGDAAALITGGLLVKAFESLGFSLLLKWPNDLLTTDNRKVGGLLLEEKDGMILAGLGVNLAESPPAAMLRSERATPAAVLLPCNARRPAPAGVNVPDVGMSPERPVNVRSVKQEPEKRGAPDSPEMEEPLAPFALWRHLVSATILEYSRSVAGRSLSHALAEFEHLLAWKGRQVTLTEADGSSCSGRYQGLGKNGSLLLRCADGSTQEFFSGSLSLTAATPIPSSGGALE